jgi:hypothetical protein
MTAEERRALHLHFGAVAVDMETAHVARLCREDGVPFVSLRAVSDEMDTPLSADLASALTGERVSLPRLALAVVRRPALVGELRRLARQTRVAADALAQRVMSLMASEVTSR